VSEAEQRGNVAWLKKRDDKDALLALGRLADKNAEAERVLSTHAPTDAVYLAAWQGVLRGSPWAEKLIRRDLATSSANIVATGMSPGDSHLAAFMVDLDVALTALPREAPQVAGLLASIGPSARTVVDKRIRDAATRDAMCAAIDTPSASDDARSALLALIPPDRDSQACNAAIVRMAGTHANVRQWLGTLAEPGLLSVAGRESMPCPAVAETMQVVIAERATTDALTMRALVVPLRHAIERCTRELDPIVATGIAARPAMAGLVASALDPRATSTTDMRATCAWLNAHSAQVPDRQVVANLLANGCKAALR